MAMTEAAGTVETAQITFAARDNEVDGKPIKQGEIMGLANGKIRFVGDNKEEIAYKTADKLFKRNKHSLVTIIYGEETDEASAESVAEMLKKKAPEEEA